MSATLSLDDAQGLLGLAASSLRLRAWIDSLASQLNTPSSKPEAKTYSDAVYLNYYTLALSLLFLPTNGYKPKPGALFDHLELQNLSLDSFDIYNILPSSSNAPPPSKQQYSTFPTPSLTFRLNPSDSSHVFQVSSDMTGKAFVEAFGEPERKGGGTGLASGSIGIWCEWTRHGLMVEFGGDDARGPQAWERGKEALWKILTVFRRGRTTTA